MTRRNVSYRSNQSSVTYLNPVHNPNQGGEGMIGDMIRGIKKDERGYPGENHMIMKLPGGSTQRAQFMGPGTRVVERLRRGDQGLTVSDKVARMHDINYALAQGAPSVGTQRSLIRDADNRMIRSMQGIRQGRHGGDSFRNIHSGLRLIQAKTKLEDMGLMSRDKFSGPLENINPADKQLLMTERSKMVQMGYGKADEDMLPGQALKMKLLRKMKREKFKSKARQTGKGKKIGLGDFLLKTVLPQLLSDLGIDKLILKGKRAVALVKASIKQSKGSIPKIIANLTRSLLPLIVTGRIKQSGSGTGKKAVALIKKISAHPMLRSEFAKALFKVVTAFMKQQMSGKGMRGSGSFWKSFFKGFKRGFKMVMVPGLKAVSLIAPNPAAQVGLNVASSVLDKIL